MSRADVQPYVFRKREQWAAGLLTRAAPVGDDGRVAPLQPYAHIAKIYQSSGARAPAFDRAGELLWLDDAGTLLRLAADGEGTRRSRVARDIAGSPRLIAGRASLAVIARSRRAVVRYELDSLQPIQSTPIEGEVLDITGDGRSGLWVLARQDKAYRLVRVDCADHIAQTIELPPEFREPSSLAYLASTSAIALLTDGGKALGFLRTDKTVERLPQELNVLAPCFAADYLASDGSNRLAVAGKDHWREGYGLLFVIDAHGQLLDRQEMNTTITGVALNAQELASASASGIALFAAIPDDRGAEASCVFITPMLHSPDRGDERGWLRAEIQASMRQGASLSVEYAATSDPELVAKAERLVTDASAPPDIRQSRLAALLENLWSTPALMHGTDAGDPEVQTTYAAPLFTVTEPYLWLRLTLTAAAGAQMPVMSELRVLYPNRSLMRELPSIYDSRASGSDFTRRLVGVLETTTQGLDRTIASIGSFIHPDTAPEKWLDVIARWLGVPWDDSLDETRKRALIHESPAILASRGTRAGLDRLLAALFPDSQSRIRVVDYTVERDVPRIGGVNCQGARLPMLIGGLPPTAVILGRRLVLGRARLCRNDICADPLALLTGRIDIVATATQVERSRIEPWLESLIRAVLPVTSRLLLQWRGPRPAAWPTVLAQDGPELLATPPTHLGATTLLGHTRFPATRPPTLTQDGPDLGPTSMS